MSIVAKLKIGTSHTKFIVIFPALLYIACNAVNLDKLTKWFPSKDGLDYWAFSAYFLAGLCLFIVFFSLFAHRFVIKPFAIALTMTSAAVTYFIAKYNVAIDSSMVLNTIHTDATEVRQLLSLQMWPYVVFLMILPVLAVVFVDIEFVGSGRYLLASLKVIGVSSLIAFTLLYLNYNAIHRAGNVSNKYIVYSLVPVNLLSGTISVISKSVKPLFATEQKEIAISGRVGSREDLVVVLAIGESSRSRNFSLYGYARRNTNPILQNVEGLHALNGIATRGTTLYALQEILKQDGITLPRLVSTLGIPTACYVNYTLYENCKSPGEVAVSACGHGGKCYDEDVVPLLLDNLRTRAPGPNFVVLHLGGGSHGPTYSDRHPPEFQTFTPMCTDADIANKCTLEQIYNSYDNTILYVDFVVGKVLGELDRSGLPYVFIYLSDHGESLMEDGRMFHGMPPGIALPDEQARIPLLVKASIPISIVKRDEYQQDDVYDTVLDLLSIDTPSVDKNGSFVKKSFAPVDR